MSFMKDYLDKDEDELVKELFSLIEQYNSVRNTYLFIYAAAITKAGDIPDVALTQDDYFTIHDMMKDLKLKKVDFYIETPGGSGEATEEIGDFLRSRSEEVAFVVCSEAKSAGTLLVLSGNEILMTESSSLGPIDAQVVVGRSVVSAHDYIEWVNEKRKEADEKGNLNSFDAIVVAQINPGELRGVQNAKSFAEEIVVEWLAKFKFRDWKATRTHHIPVTDQMKETRANEIAQELMNHSKWRSHGRSIKISDLEDLKLEITRVDDNHELAEIVYRIHAVTRMLFCNSDVYKIFAMKDEKLFKKAIERIPGEDRNGARRPDAVEVSVVCPKCDEKIKAYAKLIPNAKIDEDFKKKGIMPFPRRDKLICSCGHKINVKGLRKEIESKAGRRIVD